MHQNRVIQNAKWIIVGKIVQALMQLVIGMLSARYLGPTNYGVLSYAASVTAFVLPVAQLGMRSTLVFEFISNPEKEGEILGTSLALSMLSGLACMAGINLFVLAANHNDAETILICSLYSFSLVFQATELLQYWFQAKLLSKYSTLASVGTYLIISAYKLFLLVSRKNVFWFALSHSIEYSFLGILLVVSYWKNRGQRLSFSGKLGKKIFSRSKFYILSGLMVTVFQNTDHIMLQLMAGEEMNGFYTAAVTSTCMAGFVYTAILDSARPVLLESRNRSQEEFERNTVGLYSVMIYLSLLQSVFFTLLAEPIIRILYGAAYLEAVPVLRINVWMLTFSYLGNVRNIWILAENKHNMIWIINLSGAISNILLNAVMIPLWGASGAAGASVLTQFATNFVIGFFLKPLRPNNALLLRGFHFRSIRQLLSRTVMLWSMK